MNANTLIIKEFIGGADVHDAQGDPITLNVTIADVVKVEVGQDKEVRWALTFTGTDRKLTLNKTNIDRLIKLFGSETDAWKGKGIGLTGTTTTFGGKEVQAVRVTKPAAAGEPVRNAAAPADGATFDPDEIPF